VPFAFGSVLVPCRLLVWWVVPVTPFTPPLGARSRYRGGSAVVCGLVRCGDVTTRSSPRSPCCGSLHTDYPPALPVCSHRGSLTGLRFDFVATLAGSTDDSATPTIVPVRWQLRLPSLLVPARFITC